MKNKSLVYIFFFFVVIMTALDIATKNKTFSEIENRFLQKKPIVAIENIFSGEFSKNYEKYINDHFIARDYFINLKSISESVQLKKENNGIIYGENGNMFKKVMSIDENILNSNLTAIDKFISKNNNANLMIVPYSFSILKDQYSKNLNLIDEIDLINRVENNLGSEKTINITNTLIKHKNEYIYYRTDHHWTSYGAYLAYLEYCKNLKIEDVLELASLNENEVHDFLGTFYSKSKVFNVRGDILTYYDMPNLSMKIEDKKEESIYKLENLSKRDKYSVFLDGNHSSVNIINNNANNDKKLLVIKDSFANSMIPFIANNYKEVRVIDLRYFNYNMSDFLNSNSFNDILVLYSLESLHQDKTIVKIGF